MTETSNPVDRYLAAIEGASMPTCDALAPEVIFDATVPNWRLRVAGDAAVRGELARWFADPGSFEELRRTPTPTGELVEFTLRWVEKGVPHASHEAHVIDVAGGVIVSDRAWCGGRWSATLLAEMADAQQ